VHLVEVKGQLSDAQKSTGKDVKLLEKVAEQCKAKSADWEIREKTRAEELLAIADTIKILNDDASADLLKSTVNNPPSFLQLDTKQMRQDALHLVKDLSTEAAQKAPIDHRPGLDLLALAVSSKAFNFTKVTKMIDDMVELLRKEQKDDQTKKDFCTQQLADVTSKTKGLVAKIGGLSAAVDLKTEAIAKLVSEINTITKGINDLDNSVAQSTAQRKKENEEYKSLVQSNAQAKDLLLVAQNRLLKFYHPDMASQAPSFLQATVQMHSFDAEEEQEVAEETETEDATPPPQQYGEFKSQEGSGNKVVTMLKKIGSDLDAETAEAKHDEKQSQKLYEQMLADAKAKREADAQSLKGKEKAKADVESDKVVQAASMMNEKEELKNIEVFETQLHGDCDWLLKNFDIRKKARTDEQETLQQSKAILAGARI
jgi:uncharacterized protein YoxC